MSVSDAEVQAAAAAMVAAGGASYERLAAVALEAAAAVREPAKPDHEFKGGKAVAEFLAFYGIEWGGNGYCWTDEFGHDLIGDGSAKAALDALQKSFRRARSVPLSAVFELRYILEDDLKVQVERSRRKRGQPAEQAWSLGAAAAFDSALASIDTAFPQLKEQA